MSLKLGFSALSISGAVDQNTGSLSVFEVLEEIRVPQVPAHLPSLVITLSLEKMIPASVNEKIFIHLLTPDGKQNLLGNGDMRVPPEQRRVRAMFRFGGFPLMQFGTHRIVVSWVNEAGTKEGEALFDFEVLQAQVPPGAGQPGAPGGAPGGSGNIAH
jgi:hypothetical protein